MGYTEQDWKAINTIRVLAVRSSAVLFTVPVTKSPTPRPRLALPLHRQQKSATLFGRPRLGDGGRSGENMH